MFRSRLPSAIDVRGSHGNIWEPVALIRLSESADTPSDAEEGPGIVLKNAGKIHIVTALAAQHGGRLSSRGTESRSIGLLETGKASVLGVYDPKSFMSVEHMIWRDDGRFISFGDLSGRVIVQSVTRISEAAPCYKVKPLIELAINVANEAIHQLLFNTCSNTLLTDINTLITKHKMSGLQLSSPLTVNPQRTICQQEGEKFAGDGI